MKKILIMYATAGIGHKKAAIAVKKALDEIAPDPRECEVTLIDSLDYTNGFFKKGYLDSYLFMVNKAPSLWGFSYHLTDNYCCNLIVSKMRRANNAMHSARLADFLVAGDFDAIVSTHFFGSEVAASLKRRGRIRAKLITVVTDFRLHSWWVADPTDIYVVAGDDAKDDLIRWRVDPSRVRVLGIPVEPVFTRKADRRKVLSALGFKEGIFTILVIGGGFGVGPIEDIVATVDGMRRPVQLVVVCGHNAELMKRLQGKRLNPEVAMKVFGFVDNVYEYMEASDILISKSGGITVSESMAKELPMLVIAPIIGQETRNSEYLVKHAAAVKIDAVSELKGALEDLASHPEKVAALRESIGRIKKPNACYDIAGLALGRSE